MDDVDAVQAQIARNMLDSGDWVTARLDGVAYLEKSPLKYWMIATSYAVFGVHGKLFLTPITGAPKVRTMEIDTEKVDEAVLALLYLTLHDGRGPGRALIGSP